MEISIGDLRNKNNGQNKAQPQPQGNGIIDNSDMVNNQNNSKAGNFLGDVDKILGQVNSIMDKAQQNPLISKMVAQKLGGRIDKAQGGSDNKKSITDSKNAQSSEDIYNKILQGINFLEDNLGSEATLIEVKEFIESKPEMVKKGIEAGINGE